MGQTSTEFNLRYVLRTVRRRLPILLLCVVLVPFAAVAFSLLQKKEYTARAGLLFRDPQFDQKLFGDLFVQTQTDPARVAATNLAQVQEPRVAAMTAASLRGVTQDQVSSAVKVTDTAQSDLASIEATSPNPGFAAQLANTFANQAIVFRRDADRAQILSAQVPLQQQIASLPPAERTGALGQPLQQRIDQLGVLATLQTGNAVLVQPAEVPRGPSSPKPLVNGALGTFFGLLLAVGLVVLAEALDRRLRDPAEVEQMFERPVLAALPESAALSSADPSLLDIPAPEREAFRMLSVNLRYFSLSRDIRSVLVTSADRYDGRSTVAWGLGVAAASAGSRTLLIEADLREPSFATRFGLDSPDGLTNVLAGDTDRTEAIMRLSLPLTDDDLSPARSMDVLVAGPRPPDPTDLLQSSRMADFLADTEQEYDLIIIDTPPAAIVSDAIPLMTMVSGVIVVGRLGNTVRDHSRRLRQQLDYLDAPLLGVVLNSAGGARRDRYEYGDGYRDTTPIAGRHNYGARSSAQAEPATTRVSPRPAAPESTGVGTSDLDREAPFDSGRGGTISGASGPGRESTSGTEPEAAYRHSHGSSHHNAPPKVSSTSGLQVPQRHSEPEVVDHRGSLSLDTDVDDLLDLGSTHYSQRRYGQAEAAFRQAVEVMPDDLESHLNLGNALYAQQRYAEAAAEYRRSVELCSDDSEPLLSLGKALCAQERYDEAEPYLRRSLELDPYNAAPFLNLGDALYAQERYGEAEAAYKRSLELDPDSAAAYCNLGNALGAQRRFSDAEAAFHRAIERDRTSAAAHFNLGLALGAQERHGDAETAYRRSLELSPGNAQALGNLADALRAQGRHREAEALDRGRIELDSEGPAHSSPGGYRQTGNASPIDGKPATDGEAGARDDAIDGKSQSSLRQRDNGD